jgi:hypothetical protein
MPEVGAEERLVAISLEAFRDEYNRICSVWDQLDRKAQGAVAISGIFLAAVFASIRELKATSDLERVLLGGAVLFLVLSVLSAIRALQVQEVSDAPSGSQIRDLVDAVMSVSPEELGERLPRLLSDQISLWEMANNEILKANERKAQLVSRCQWMLFTAVVVFSFLALARVLGGTGV